MFILVGGHPGNMLELFKACVDSFKRCFMFIFSARFVIFYGLLLFLWMDVKMDDTELKNRCK